MSTLSKWTDLRPRLISGAVMAAVGLAAIWAGGIWFAALAIVAATLMLWELAMMQVPEKRGEAMAIAGLGTLGLFGSFILPLPMALYPLTFAAVAALLRPRHDKLIFAVYGTAILLACYGLVAFRQNYGMLWLGWLVAVVVVSDVAGYFAGRMLGGPKFWPRVSPKKTWSGTVAGWVAAAGVGLVFLTFTTAGRDLPLLSAALALASQLGDIVESAIKRRAGVKDSSNLIPGHGGLLDRFDALLGGALFMLILSLFVIVPVVRG